MTYLNRLGMLTAASLFALSVSGIGVVLAAGDPEPPSSRNPNPIQQQSPASKATKDSATKPKKKKTSEQEFATATGPLTRWCRRVTTRQPSTLSAALDADDTPGRRQLHGHTARKMGDYQLSKLLVRARARETTRSMCAPGSTTACGRSNRATCSKAADYLENIRLICGTTCKEYQDLKGGMEGTVAY